MKLSFLFFALAVVAMVVGSVTGIAPAIVLAAKIVLVVSILLGLGCLIAALAKSEAISHHRVARS